MNLDDLKAQWRIEMQHTGHADVRFEGIKGEVSEFRRAGRNAAFWMIFAHVCGSALAVFFGWLTRDDVGWLSKLGIAAYVIATIWMTFTLLRARKVTRSDDWTLRSRLEIEIERLEKQRNLYNRVGVWLLAPMSVFIVLSTLGRHHDLTGGYLPDLFAWTHFYSVWLAMCALVYWLCRREITRKFDPLLSRLKGLYRELVEN
jgi:hypothetical protein